jgi:acetyl-CoA acyltransferase
MSEDGKAVRDRVAVVAGLRTPFCKAGTDLRELRTVDLAVAVVKELIARTGIRSREISLCVYGQVVPTLDWINLAREVVLGAGLQKETDAYSVSRACATSIQTTTDAAQAILLGEHDAAIVGGADSLSDVPIGLSRKLRGTITRAQKSKGWVAKMKAVGGLSPKDLAIAAPGFIREASTGEQMGEAAEKMAKDNGISRLEQDEIALRSHQGADAAWKSGKYEADVMHVIAKQGAVTKDNLVRGDTSLDALAKLPPVFDRRHGTITAGNASPLTDGASALILMRESKAKALGYEPLGYLRAWAYAAVDPAWQLLQAPAFAIPKVLDRAGFTLADMEVVEMHEAFAAQLASNLQALGSKRFAEEKLGRAQATGEVDPARLNVNGGSIAIGHPFAATGARLILQTLRELERKNAQLGLVSVCAGGGLGAAMVLEAS